VIKSFADKRTAAVFAGYLIRALPNQIESRARAKLLAIDAAKQLDDLRTPPGNRDRPEQYSVRINDQWRIMSRSWITTEDDAMSIKREDLDAGRIDLGLRSLTRAKSCATIS